jgi:DNA replication protein DnaC
MRPFLPTLQRALAEAARPPAPDDVVGCIARKAEARFAELGYLQCPATPAVCRHYAEVRASLNCPDRWREPVRGLAMFGTVGTGKTTALTIMAAACHWQVFAFYELARRYEVDGGEWLDDWLREIGGDHVVLDDLGAEGEGKHYGAALPVADIICDRYDRWKHMGRRTYLTSNLTAEDRIKRYGARVGDRIAEMCDVVPCVWPSFRGGR